LKKRLNEKANRSAGISFLYALWHSPMVRSHLTLDDVDFTILAATSVLADLIPNCPPAEACRDAFTRMAKATISMCMSTTGFGVASSLGSQTLDSPVSYVSPGQLSNDNSYDNGGGYVDVGAEMMPRRSNSDGERRQLPKFDMNLKDLFSDIELQGRSQSFFPQIGPRANMPQQQQQQQQQRRQDPAPFTGQTYAIPSTPETSSGTAASPLQYQQQQQSNLRQQKQQQQQQQTAYTYQPLSQTISQQPPPEFSFDTLDFLDTFLTADSNANGDGMGNDTSNSTNNNNLWPSAELDLGFGTGGMAGWEEGGSSMEGVGAGGGGPDLFDGFFFGTGGTGGGGGGGAYGGQF
jgi:hypothetical protein